MDFNCDSYSKTMTLRIIYQLIELIDELRTVRDERDGLQLLNDQLRKTLREAEGGGKEDGE